jgi:hypothetical protein
MVTPVPRIGDVVVGRDAVGRVLRISWHPMNDRLVLSIWQDDGCLATVRLAGRDVIHLVGTLAGLADLAGLAVAATDPVPRAS